MAKALTQPNFSAISIAATSFRKVSISGVLNRLDIRKAQHFRKIEHINSRVGSIWDRCKEFRSGR